MPENQQKLKVLKQTLKNIKKETESALTLLWEILNKENDPKTPNPVGLGVEKKTGEEQSFQKMESKDDLDLEIADRVVREEKSEVSPGARIIEGVFNGQEMVDHTDKQYSVPANYASKSKLVEGDVLKLIITREGVFIYKQIKPIERQRLIGILVKDKETGEYRISAQGKTYKVLMASITYFKGEEDDRVIILVPRDKPSTWAAVENVIKM